MKKLIGIILLSVLVFALCGPAPAEKTPEDSLKEIFGVYEEYPIGVTDIQKDADAGYSIYFRYRPMGLLGYDKEISRTFADIIGKAYKELPELDKISVHVLGPVEDKFGNVVWSEICIFGFSRALYSKFNWDKFNDDLFLVVADDVQKYY
jgi:hypothetical protein